MPAGQFAVISPGKEKIEFHYTALSLIVPERVLFKYKLEGFDKEWVEVGTRRVAYYTNLPPGKYSFCVEAANSRSLAAIDSPIHKALKAASSVLNGNTRVPSS